MRFICTYKCQVFFRIECKDVQSTILRFQSRIVIFMKVMKFGDKMVIIFSGGTVLP